MLPAEIIAPRTTSGPAPFHAAATPPARSTASTPGKRDSLALGENRFTHFRGDAYNLFTTASEKQGFLVKGQLLTLMFRYRYQDAPH